MVIVKMSHLNADALYGQTGFCQQDEDLAVTNLEVCAKTGPAKDKYLKGKCFCLLKYFSSQGNRGGRMFSKPLGSILQEGWQAYAG